jgi:hypothetical protein
MARAFTSATSGASLAACAAGALLHLYTAAFKATGGLSLLLVGLVLLSCVPYAIAAALASRARTSVFGLGAALACLVVDIYVHYTVFVAPKSSTAAVGLVVTPFFNLLLVGPMGALVLWLGARLAAAAKGAR